MNLQGVSGFSVSTAPKAEARFTGMFRHTANGGDADQAMEIMQIDRTAPDRFMNRHESEELNSTEPDSIYTTAILIKDDNISGLEHVVTLTRQTANRFLQGVLGALMPEQKDALLPVLTQKLEAGERAIRELNEPEANRDQALGSMQHATEELSAFLKQHDISWPKLIEQNPDLFEQVARQTMKEEGYRSVEDIPALDYTVRVVQATLMTTPNGLTMIGLGGPDDSPASMIDLIQAFLDGEVFGDPQEALSIPATPTPTPSPEEKTSPISPWLDWAMRVEDAAEGDIGVGSTQDLMRGLQQMGWTGTDTTPGQEPNPDANASSDDSHPNA
ncbi:MAG: hypothetical protein SFZ03_12175 [Candidatus Melainabacteria bacterium]|nr:hypothetical protein [Candidatus Melainabacteria bacterium]